MHDTAIRADIKVGSLDDAGEFRQCGFVGEIKRRCFHGGLKGITTIICATDQNDLGIVLLVQGIGEGGELGSIPTSGETITPTAGMDNDITEC